MDPTRQKELTSLERLDMAEQRLDKNGQDYAPLSSADALIVMARELLRLNANLERLIGTSMADDSQAYITTRDFDRG